MNLVPGYNFCKQKRAAKGELFVFKYKNYFKKKYITFAFLSLPVQEGLARASVEDWQGWRLVLDLLPRV